VTKGERNETNNPYVYRPAVFHGLFGRDDIASVLKGKTIMTSEQLKIGEMR
jgi:hypothetical protein